MYTQLSGPIGLPVDPVRVGLAMGYRGLQSQTSGPAAGVEDDLK